MVQRRFADLLMSVEAKCLGIASSRTDTTVGFTLLK